MVEWLNVMRQADRLCDDKCLVYFCEKHFLAGYSEILPVCSTTTTTLTSTSTETVTETTTTSATTTETAAAVAVELTTLDPLSGILGDGLTTAPVAAVLPVATGSMPADVGAANALGATPGLPDLLDSYSSSVGSTASFKWVAVFAALAASAAMMAYFVSGRRSPVNAEEQDVLTVGE